MTGRAAGAAAAEAVGTVTAERARVRRFRLEDRFGDPADPANPVGIPALLRAERRGELLGEAEALLDDEGFGAELVPERFGGRLVRADLLAAALRPVFRRDVALGFGYGITSLFAASAVWAAGSGEQRERLSRLLRGGGRATIVHHELAHGSALLRGEFTAVPAPDGRGHLLMGHKDTVINAERAGAFVIYARTAAESAAVRTHSVFLAEPDSPAGPGLRLMPRRETTGMRGCRFAGVELDGYRVGPRSLVGAEGEGVLLALRTFQLNRSLIPAALIAGSDTVLRAAVRAAPRDASRRPGPRHRAVLAGVFADLLLCDALTQAALRALHVLPDSAHLIAAAVKYLVPDLLRDDLEELATVLRSRGGALGDGDRETLHKLLRDVPAAGLGHAGSAACLAVLVPQLPVLARRSWFRDPEPPPVLYGTGPGLPPLDLGALGAAGGPDALAASLPAVVERLPGLGTLDGYGAALTALGRAFVAELSELREQCPRPGSAARAHALADRYASVVAAAAALARWESELHRSGGPADGWAGDPAWPALALSRLAARLGLAVPAPPPGCVDRVHTEVERRYREGTGYDLLAEPVRDSGALLP